MIDGFTFRVLRADSRKVHTLHGRERRAQRRPTTRARRAAAIASRRASSRLGSPASPRVRRRVFGFAPVRTLGAAARRRSPACSWYGTQRLAAQCGWLRIRVRAGLLRRGSVVGLRRAAGFRRNAGCCSRPRRSSASRIPRAVAFRAPAGWAAVRGRQRPCAGWLVAARAFMLANGCGARLHAASRGSRWALRRCPGAPLAGFAPSVAKLCVSLAVTGMSRRCWRMRALRAGQRLAARVALAAAGRRAVRRGRTRAHAEWTQTRGRAGRRVAAAGRRVPAATSSARGHARHAILQTNTGAWSFEPGAADRRSGDRASRVPRRGSRRSTSTALRSARGAKRRRPPRPVHRRAPPPGSTNTRYYNSRRRARYGDPQFYRKHHLVPFGETSRSGAVRVDHPLGALRYR